MSHTDVDIIKERLSIDQVIGGYITLERSGANMKARCPFHTEKTPSFHVSPDRGSYYCFGCGAKGDIFSFVQAFEGLDFRGALQLLALRAGVELKGVIADKDDKSILYELMEAATVFFEQGRDKQQIVWEYLRGRGLTDDTIRDFRIGAIGSEWRTLSQYLKQKGYKDADIVRAGLAKESDKGLYDRFRSRIIFPIADSSGRIVAFTGRLLHDDPEAPKYLNSPDTPIFDKSRIFYGIDRAKSAIRMNKRAVFVEGQFDLILSHQAGVTEAVAVSGTALTDEIETEGKIITHLGIIKRLADTIIIAFDADKAGIKATGRAARIGLALGMNVTVVRIPEGKDPADYIRSAGKDAWKALLKHATHIITFYLNLILEKITDGRLRAKKIEEILVPYLAVIESAIERSSFIHIIEQKTGIPEQALTDDIRRHIAKIKTPTSVPAAATVVPEKKEQSIDILSHIVGTYLWQKELRNEPLTELIEKELTRILGQPIEDILDRYKDQKIEITFMTEVLYGSRPVEKIVEELLIRLESSLLQEKIEEKKHALIYAETEKIEEDRLALLTEMQELSKNLAALRNKFYQ